ncbi:MAG: hypothetical protein AWU59_982 [Methanolobus sp. T82-4]|nr:MAG: hypothetical protein AWU59_982 [Methanolobus sp. T82-4]
MKTDTKSRIITVSIITFIITLAVAAAIITDMGVQKDLTYTDEELQKLYYEYGITENDLKFAKGELPNYLNDTVLVGNRVIVTEDGLPPENMELGVDYDLVLSEREMEDIIENARMDYIEKYGVDPANPKIDSVYGYLLPKEEADRIMESANDMSY